MYLLRHLKTALWVALGALLILSGWWVNGWRWEARYEALVASNREALVRAEQEARAKEQALQTAIDTERTQKDARIKALDRKLASALDQLRQRPLRSAVPVCQTAGNPETPAGATGAQLYREDAEFLAREAARADQIIIELKSCYAAYDAAKNAR